MGTHPIFEPDFDCLTELHAPPPHKSRQPDKTPPDQRVDRFRAAPPSQMTANPPTAANAGPPPPPMVAPRLIEPDQNDNDQQNPLFRDIIKLRLDSSDAGSNAPSSCGEDDDEPEQTFDDVLASDPTWSQPANDVLVQMVALLDHYFSDENLIKDKFLLKHVRRNKQGYVSVKLLTSFKKLKHLSRSDWRVTAYCCRHSKQLELNTSGTKVKRRDQLPQIDLPTTSIRTILAKVPCEEMSPCNMTVDQISEIFRPFGCLSTVRLIRPGKEIPLDLRNHTAKHPEIGGQTCVVVEFDRTEDCQMAYKTLGKKAREENSGWEYNLLGSGRNPRRQHKKEKAKELAYMRYGGYDSSEEFNSTPYASSRENSPEVRRRTFPANPRNQSYLSPSPLASPYGSRSNSPARHYAQQANSPGFQRRVTTGSQGGGQVGGDKWNIRSKHLQSPLSLRKQITSPVPGASGGKNMPTSPLAAPNNTFKSNNNNNDEIGGSPWVRRRKDFLAASQGNTPIGSPCASPTLGRKQLTSIGSGEMDQVLRNPRGPPDNATKGFQPNHPSGVDIGSTTTEQHSELRALTRLDMLSTQVAAAVCSDHK